MCFFLSIKMCQHYCLPFWFSVSFDFQSHFVPIKQHLYLFIYLNFNKERKKKSLTFFFYCKKYFGFLCHLFECCRLQFFKIFFLMFLLFAFVFCFQCNFWPEHWYFSFLSWPHAAVMVASEGKLFCVNMKHHAAIIYIYIYVYI